MIGFYRRVFRLWNVFLCQASYYLRLGHCLGLPYQVHLEAANYCNLSCALCPAGTDKKRAPQCGLSLEQAKLIIAKLAPALKILYLHGFGEPFLNKEIYPIIAWAKNNTGAWIEISTNAQLFTAEDMEKLVSSRLDRLLIPIEGKGQDYNIYRRGGDYAKVEGFIKEFSGYKALKRVHLPRIVVQITVMRHNESSLSGLKQHFLQCGADEVLFKTAGVLNRDFAAAAQYLPEDNALCRYKPDGLTPKSRPRCKDIYNSLFISSTADAYPCCRDALLEHPLGNIADGSLGEIWNVEKITRMRAKLNKGKFHDFSSCSVCCPGDLYLKKVK